MIQRIGEALRCNKRAYERIRDYLCPGQTELEILKQVEMAYLEQAGEKIPYEYDLVSGKRSGEIGGYATEKAVEPGDCLIADLLPNFQGAWCDTTRTFFLGEPKDELKRAYAALLCALRQGEELLLPGVSGAEIFHKVDVSLCSSGFSGLPHHAGHVVGAKPLDDPDFLPECSQVLEEGMVVTLEPGIYFPENGMRIENNYLITKTGGKLLFSYPEEMDYFVIRRGAE